MTDTQDLLPALERERVLMLERTNALTSDIARDVEALDEAAESLRSAATLADIESAIARMGSALEAFLPSQQSRQGGANCGPATFDRHAGPIRAGLNSLAYLHRDLAAAGAELPEVE